MAATESELDQFDHRILDALTRDGRMSITDLSTVVGLSKTPCQVRLRRLIDEGYIEGFHARINQRKLGRDHIAFAEVKLSDTKEEALREFNAAVRKIKEVEECHMIAGRIDYLCEIISTAKPQIDGKNVKALAILTKTRSPVEKDVPTSAEQGLDVQAYTWNAIFLPKGTPDAIVKKLNGAMVQAMHDAGVKDRLEGFGAQVVSDDRATPDYLGKFVKDEIVKWAAPIKASGVSVN